jgi:hypothetical protein
MKPLPNGTIRCRHLGYRSEDVTLSLRSVFGCARLGFQLLGAGFYRGFFSG